MCGVVTFISSETLSHSIDDKNDSLFQIISTHYCEDPQVLHTDAPVVLPDHHQAFK